jgi:medium-chain acyl-[acyl-carrier-protein] hydrolase
MYVRWAERFSDDIAVCPVQLPGREDRLREPAIKDMEDLIETIASILNPLLDRPFAFFGHSMGALISYELARYLRRHRRQFPLHLWVSARRAPHVLEPYSRIGHLPDRPFFEEIRRRYDGIPDVIFQDPEIMEIMAPALRADFTVLENYKYIPDKPLDCPITVLGGAQDALIPTEDLEAWRFHTKNHCSVSIFPGGHFFLQPSREAVLQLMSQEILEVMPTGNSCAAGF